MFAPHSATRAMRNFTSLLSEAVRERKVSTARSAVHAAGRNVFCFEYTVLHENLLSKYVTVANLYLRIY
jgi:hypothetical protein